MLSPLRVVCVLLLAAVLAGCGTSGGPGSSSVGGYKIGKPYQVKGVWYYPAEDFNYRETGIASWYGPGFHAKSTANGERYDQNDMTAAHRTLPMPSIVRVTNLENGRSIVVRVNDRGPFANNRIIDMSKRGAETLGFIGKGTARVQVEVMKAESQAVAAAAKRGESTREYPVMASAAPREKVETVSLPPVSAPLPPEKTEVAVYQMPPEKQAAVAAPTDVQLRNQQVQQYPVHATRMYIQVGAFSIYDNATRQQQKLTAAVARASISVVQIDGREVYRVRLGPVATVEESDALLDRAIAAGFKEARTVVEKP